MALPTLIPQAKASEAIALAKGDRLAELPARTNCSNQIWPNFDASCLRASGTGAVVQQARLVTIRR